MGNTFATIVLVVDVVLGAFGFTWWLVPPLAIAGMLIYFSIRPLAYETITMRGDNIVGGLATVYLTQVITASAFFGAGRLIGMLF